MLMRDMFLVLPKVSTYNAFSVEEQLDFREHVLSYVKYAKELQVGIFCFVEDVLATKLLWKQDGVHWRCVVGSSDQMYLCGRSDLYGKLCSGGVKSESEKSVKAAMKRYPYPRELLRGEESDEANARRDSILAKRIRAVCNEVLQDKAGILVYFKIGENFCSVPKVNVGDGRKLILVSEDRTVYFYGGLALEEETFKQALKGELMY